MSDSKPHNILVVEDDEHIAYLLRFLLEREGYSISLARDGLEARQHIENSAPPSLAVLDVMLPYVDGFQLVSEIRAQPKWTRVPVLMLTAKSQESDIIRALDAGANDYITKPFQPNELRARVRRYLKSDK